MAVKKVQPSATSTARVLPGDALNVSLDFSSVKTFEPLPAGVYTAVLKKAEIGLSKNQQPKIAIEMLVTAPEEYADKKIFDNPSLQEQALFKVKNLIEALGGEPKQIRNSKALAKLLEESLDTTLGVALSVDKQDRNQVSRYLSEDQIPE